MDKYSFIKKEDIMIHPIFDEDCEYLFDAVKNDSLIVFIGAGVSKLVGCLGWNELAEKIVKIGRQEGILNFLEEEVLLKEIMNPRKVISICFKMFDNKDKKKLFYDLLIKFTDIVDKSNLDVFRKILDLKAKAYITTNIDDGLIQFNPPVTRQNIYDCTSKDFEIFVKDDLLVRDGNIFFLHGRRNIIENTIFTIDRYLEFYKRDYINDFLKNKIFTDNNVVLFIGYGLGEWEILEYLFRSQSNNSNYSSFINRYLLMPLYSSDYVKLNLDRIFYDFFNIITIPYFIDFEGYYKLSSSLDKLIKSINDYQPTASVVFNQIDKVLENNE